MFYSLFVVFIKPKYGDICKVNIGDRIVQLVLEKLLTALLEKVYVFKEKKLKKIQDHSVQQVFERNE